MAKVRESTFYSKCSGTGLISDFHRSSITKSHGSGEKCPVDVKSCADSKFGRTSLSSSAPNNERPSRTLTSSLELGDPDNLHWYGPREDGRGCTRPETSRMVNQGSNPDPLEFRRELETS